MSKVIIGKLNAISVYIAWTCLGIGGLLLPITGILFKEIFPVAITFFIFGIAIIPIHILLSFFVRCPHCGKCLTIQVLRAKNGKANQDKILNGWATVVINWFSGNINCIHCSKVVDTNNL